jgi:hypothetical protein
MKRLIIRLLAFLPLAETTVLLEAGRVRTVRGRVSPALGSELAELASSHALADACIHARRTAGGHALTIIGVPRALHQRVRNVWAANAR